MERSEFQQYVINNVRENEQGIPEAIAFIVMDLLGAEIDYNTWIAPDEAKKVIDAVSKKFPWLFQEPQVMHGIGSNIPKNIQSIFNMRNFEVEGVIDVQDSEGKDFNRLVNLTGLDFLLSRAKEELEKESPDDFKKYFSALVNVFIKLKYPENEIAFGEEMGISNSTLDRWMFNITEPGQNVWKRVFKLVEDFLNESR